MNSNKVLLCFTASYPYGNRETYFANELNYLAKAFKIVYIWPTYNPTGSETMRSIPSNVKVLKPVVPNGFTRVVQGIFNTSPITLFFLDFFCKRAYKNGYTIKKWFNALLVFRIKYQKLKTFLNSHGDNLVLYSYWGGATIYTSKLCKAYPKVMRMHGGDFYLNRNYGYLPLVQKIYDNTDLLLPISNDISNILQTHYNISPKKIFVNYLGVDNELHNQSARNDDVIRIVSCSNLVELKRVFLIAQLIVNWKHDIPIEWHHFGDGAEAPAINDIIKNYSGANKIFLHGWAVPEELYKFYSTVYIHWFLNVSKYEGVPVSIMEAFSFGIPCIATNVGATSEIVNADNGYLIDIQFEFSELEKLVLSINEENYESKRTNAYSTWKNKFDANKNYNELIDKLHML
ncbi:MAG: glycosyltransferase [Chitinophagaceae bacterium]|nr:glycosyltransferase [Chitinophagaceae bacterium]